MNYARLVRQVKAQLTARRKGADNYAFCACSIPRQLCDIDSGNAALEHGTVFCPWCSDVPEGCAVAETPERLVEFERHVAWLRMHNIRATREARRITRKRTEETMNLQRQVLA